MARQAAGTWPTRRRFLAPAAHAGRENRGFTSGLIMTSPETIGGPSYQDQQEKAQQELVNNIQRLQKERETAEDSMKARKLRQHLIQQLEELLAIKEERSDTEGVKEIETKLKELKVAEEDDS